jgi:glycosyltransferase involved in cell wall biosynthesis
MKKSEQNTKVGFYVTSDSWNNHQRWHYEIGKALHERGYAVKVITPTRGRLYARARRYGLNVFKLRKAKGWLPDLLRLYLVLRKEKITTLFINYPGDLKAGALAARFAGVRQLVYRRGTVSHIRRNWLNRMLFGHFIQTVVTNSRANRRRMIHQQGSLFRSPNTRVIYNGLNVSDESRSHTPSHDYRKNGELLVGLITGDIEAGRLVRLMELIQRSKKTGDYRFLLHGNGRNFKNIHHRLQKQPALRQMMVCDSRSHNLGEFMESIDIFLTGNTKDQLNHNLLHAMAHRKPVIAYDEGSNPEIVTHKENGYLLQSGDLNGILEKLDILCDENIRLQLGREARRSIEKHFDFKQTIDQIEELIK